MRFVIKLALATALTAAALPTGAATTGATGSGNAFSNYQPSLALTELLNYSGIYPSNSDGGYTDGASFSSLGMIRNYASGFVPGNAQADGRHLSSATSATLYSIIGTAYGSYGGTDFAAPDLRGTTIVGATTPNGQVPSARYDVGQQTGTGGVTLTIDQLPAHGHTLPGGGNTDLTGGGLPFDQRQPSLSLTYMIAAGGVYPGSGAAVSIGQVAAFAGPYVVNGWRAADGSVLSIADYSTLFGIIGNTYGGDGITTFALPDLRSRTIVGAGAGAGLRPVALGEAFGSNATVLTLGQLAAHDHDLGGPVTGTAGGGAPVDNYQASLGLNYLIATDGAFPTRESELDGEAPYLGEVIAWAGTAIPRGWALADGSLVNIAQNSALFSLLGTSFGGNGANNFALPDLRGRTIIGTSAGIIVGDQFGVGSNALTVANLPTHSHDFTVAGSVPEPASWALMIAGFGLTGTSLRRRRTLSVAA